MEGKKKVKRGDIALWLKTLALSALVICLGFGASVMSAAVILWLATTTSPWVADYSNLQ